MTVVGAILSFMALGTLFIEYWHLIIDRLRSEIIHIINLNICHIKKKDTIGAAS